MRPEPKAKPMCDICVMNKVKDQMASGRGGPVSALSPPALITGHAQIHDMTHTLHEAFPTYEGTPQLSRDHVLRWERDSCNLFNLTFSEHVGTHIDAPLHYDPDGGGVSEIAISDLIVPLCVIDIKARAAHDADAQVTPDDIHAWIARNGDIPAHACVAMNSGWGAKVQGDGFRNADDAGVQHYPGFHVEAAQMLKEDTAAMSIAVDTLSLDHGPSESFDTHCTWLPSGRFGIEALANLDSVPEQGATLVIGAPKVRGGTGGPARIFAMV